MLERLDESFQHERQLTSDVSHELRTPLGMLKTQLSLARSRPREADELREMMRAMEGDVDRMTRLTEQMLTLARVEQAGPGNRPRVALGDVLSTLHTEFTPVAEGRSIKLTVSAPTEIDLTVEGDVEQLRQVFANLMENAIKYTPADGNVDIRIERDWSVVHVNVSDTGVGIPASELPRVFERFHRVDTARARESGSFGLGLAIANTSVTAHGGKIDVQSAEAVGTTFTVSLPAENSPPRDQAHNT
jgi:signal transduction histidine kinase